MKVRIGMFKKFIEKIIFINNQTRTNEDIFGEIYKRGLWNENHAGGGYYSGKGSDDKYGIPYAECICDFCEKHNIKRIVDLGCGDFRVGSKLTGACEYYTGVDCVEELIRCNQKKYGNDKTAFLYKDITDDELPDGDLCLCRQVLQHLNNSQIQMVMENIKRKNYKYVIITEHLLNNPKAEKNLDKISGMHTRLFLGSGVYLDSPPFHYKIQKLACIPYDRKSHLEVMLVYM